MLTVQTATSVLIDRRETQWKHNLMHENEHSRTEIKTGNSNL